LSLLWRRLRVASVPQVVIHAHTAREEGTVSGLISVLNPKNGEVTKSSPRCLLKGQTAVVEITPARSMCLECYTDYRALGRVALRMGGRTIAVGIVARILD
jgi:elongation factor 1 alpha-like protein